MYLLVTSLRLQSLVELTKIKPSGFLVKKHGIVLDWSRRINFSCMFIIGLIGPVLSYFSKKCGDHARAKQVFQTYSSLTIVDTSYVEYWEIGC